MDGCLLKSLALLSRERYRLQVPADTHIAGTFAEPHAYQRDSRSGSLTFAGTPASRRISSISTLKASYSTILS